MEDIPDIFGFRLGMTEQECNEVAQTLPGHISEQSSDTIKIVGEFVSMPGSLWLSFTDGKLSYMGLNVSATHPTQETLQTPLYNEFVRLLGPPDRVLGDGWEVAWQRGSVKINISKYQTQGKGSKDLVGFTANIMGSE